VQGTLLKNNCNCKIGLMEHWWLRKISLMPCFIRAYECHPIGSLFTFFESKQLSLMINNSITNVGTTCLSCLDITLVSSTLRAIEPSNSTLIKLQRPPCYQVGNQITVSLHMIKSAFREQHTYSPDLLDKPCLA
jgi:hypothetical protein